MASTGDRTAFVFDGGGGLGAIQVGMLSVLRARGIPKGVVAKALHAVTLLIACQLMHELETMLPDI